MFNGRCTAASVTRIANGSSRPTGRLAGAGNGDLGYSLGYSLGAQGLSPARPPNTHKPRQYAYALVLKNMLTPMPSKWQADTALYAKAWKNFKGPYLHNGK